MKKFVALGIAVLVIGMVASFQIANKEASSKTFPFIPDPTRQKQKSLHPLFIESLQSRSYDSPAFVVESTYPDAYNSSYYRVSYESDGLKLFGLLTIPKSDVPEGGYPAIVFNHGYIPPDQYRTNERYIAYVGGLANAGYIVFRPDYRGHDKSEGVPTGAYTSESYLVDILNGTEALKKHELVDPKKIGIWGHSLGGHLLLKAMVVSDDFAAGSSWAGVVAPLHEVFDRWQSRREARWRPSERERESYEQARRFLYGEVGEPASGSKFWEATYANNHLAELSGPLQIHHGTGDTTVDWQISESLHNQLNSETIEHEYYLYQGDDHNMSGSYTTAMQRTVKFFNEHVKGE